MSKPILLDGASGTGLWEIAERNGVAKDPVWKYNVEHPDFVAELAKGYIDAGSEIILANTFSANGPSVKRSSAYSVEEIVVPAVEIAKSQTAGTNVKVNLNIGPLTMLLEPYGDLTEEEAEEIFTEIIAPGIRAGADGVTIETFMDIEMMKIAARVACSYDVPVLCSMSFEQVGKTMFGNSVEDVIEGLSEFPVAGIGMNCSVGPESAIPIIKEFAEKTDIPVIAKPNAGLPIMSDDGSVSIAYTAEQFAADMKEVVPYVGYLGACCGSNASYIRELKKLLG